MYCTSEAIRFIGTSELSQDEKDTLGGILLADQSLAAGINLLLGCKV